MAHEVLAREFLQAWNAHNADAAVQIMTEDCLFEPSVGPYPWGHRFHGRSEVKTWATETFFEIPDLCWDPIRSLFGEDHLRLRVPRHGDSAHWGTVRPPRVRHPHPSRRHDRRQARIQEGSALRIPGSVVRRAKEARHVLEMNLSVEVGSAADVVWKIVGNFNGMPAWHPLVRASVLEPSEGGVGRRLTIGGDRAGHRELIERLVFFDVSAREYAYTIIAGPVPFTDYVGRFRVVPVGTGRCTLEYRGRYKPEAGRLESEASDRIRTFYEAAFSRLPVLFGA